MKNFLKKGLAAISILVIIFLPYLLIIDFKKYTPVVLLVWSVMVAFFIFVRKRDKRGREK